MNFERGNDPFKAMDIGYEPLVKKQVKDWLIKNNKISGTSFDVKMQDKEINIYHEGDVVLEDLDIANAKGIQGVYSIKFSKKTGNRTILDELTREQIISRIKKCYENALKLLPVILNKNQTKFYGVIIPEDIHDTLDYIGTLTDKPSDEQIKDLVNKILNGSLCNAQDENSVTMGQYAKELEKGSRKA
jgi:hypothetical protein